jgi:hypothetical protein
LHHGQFRHLPDRARTRAPARRMDGIRIADHSLGRAPRACAAAMRATDGTQSPHHSSGFALRACAHGERARASARQSRPLAIVVTIALRARGVITVVAVGRELRMARAPHALLSYSLQLNSGVSAARGF